MIASTDNGDVNLTLGGAIASSTVSSATISTDQSSTTTLSIAVTDQSITNGYANITIQKTAVPYGTTPKVYINNQLAANQGYKETAGQYYVWYTTSYHTYGLTVIFTPTPQSNGLPWWLFVAITIIVALCIAAIFLQKIVRQKAPENDDDDEYIFSM